MSKVEKTLKEEGYVRVDDLLDLPVNRGLVEALKKAGVYQGILEELRGPHGHFFYNKEDGELYTARSWTELAQQQRIKPFNEDFTLDNLVSMESKNLARNIRNFWRSHGVDTGGGQQIFHAPGPDAYERGVIMHIHHDGGAHARFINMDYEAYRLVDAFNAMLELHGYWIEYLTTTLSSVYKRP